MYYSTISIQQFNSLGSAGLKDLRLAPIGPSFKVRLYYFLAYLKTPAYNNLAVDKDRLNYQAHDVPAK